MKCSETKCGERKFETKHADTKCAMVRNLFSPYIDGRVSGAEMRLVTRHIEQ